MRIVETYSHLNGLEFLVYHKKPLWDEIKEGIAEIDALRLRKKVSKEKRTRGRRFFAPKLLNAAFDKKFKSLGWQPQTTRYWVTKDASLIRRTLAVPAKEQKAQIAASGLEPISSYNQTDFVKDRVAVEVQFGKYSFIAYDLFVKHMAFFVGDVIDLGIEILPMKEMQKEMSSGIGYYEGELYNLVRQGRGIPAVPLIVVGVAP
jgi:hypothetical protein